MARVTATEVKEIMDNCTVSDPIVETMIGAATEVVDQAFANDTTIGTTLLKEIERWFTAHMLASTLHRQASEEKLDDAAVKYTGQWGKNLESTSYGQMVLTLDTSGKMAKLGKRSASTFAIPSFD